MAKITKKKVIASAGIVSVVAAIVAHSMKKKAQKTTYPVKEATIDAIPARRMNFYEKYVKRAFDVICASGAILVCSPLYLGVAILV